MKSSILAFLKKRIRFIFRLISKPRTVLLSGKKIEIDYENWSRKMVHVLFMDNYEVEERTLISNILNPADRVLEIGSAVGFVGMLIADVVGEKNVIMVEANPKLIRLAKRNLELNGVAPILIHAAAVAQNGADTTPFHVHEDFWSSSLAPKAGAMEPIDVPAVTLESLIDRYRPNVLVMDIEGGEYDLLTQADLTGLDKICVEVHAHYIGDDKVSALIRHLILKGFDLNLAHQQGDNLYFVRAKPGIE